jgi:hypothetical protein
VFTRLPMRRLSHLAWPALVLAALFSLGALPAAPPAEAAANGLTWKISQHAWASSNLSPAHQMGAPAIKDPVNGFVFPPSSVYYRPATGEMDVEFDGSVTLGNFVQGGYRIMLDNPTIEVDAAGNGTVRADVSYCASAADCLNPMVGPVIGAKITTFFLPDPAVTDTGTHVEFTVTPFWSTAGNQFHQEFLDALPVTLQGHFRATGSSLDPNKPPAPLTVAFDYTPVGGAVTLAVSGGSDASGIPSPALIAAVVVTLACAGGAGLFLHRKVNRELR